MKKLIIFLFAIFYMNVFASGQSNTWIQTEEGTVYCKNVVIKSETSHIVLENGDKKDIPTADIIAYSNNGTIFKKLPYPDKESGEMMTFMELLKSRGDLSLYSFRDSDGNFKNLVFKGDKLYQVINDLNREEFSDYFMTTINF